AVDEAAVVGVPNDLTGQEIVAVVRLKPGARADRPALEAFCRERFAPANRPSAVLVADAFPLGTTGKILKRELRAWAGARLSSI
ncbi:MAG: hypothetical protein HY553_03475, partial [Elusimicrobia bacterium]|nr:hypothetical protein [Elusimicrobiota bacterium]